MDVDDDEEGTFLITVNVDLIQISLLLISVGL